MILNRCQQMVYVDKQDYQEIETLSCPFRGCNYMWCKLCSPKFSICAVEVDQVYVRRQD